ncbi:MAG TPA: hypothetical protein VKZ68_11195 [Ohtaekwangia sp.]|nr:hypothetical protein [Ohtaekwangia sp.]
MRTATLILLILALFASGKAQIREKLIGKWDYYTIRNVEEKEPISRSMLKIVVGENSFYNFYRDGKYILFENNAYFKGNWKLADNNKKLVLTSELGTTQSFEVVSLSANTLVLLIKNDAYHTLVRDNQPFHLTRIENQTDPAGTVVGSADELSRKWLLTEFRDSLETAEVNDQMTAIVKGSWFDFRKDGRYSRKMITHEKSGRWKFQNGNRTLIMIDDDGFGSVWNISFISPTELVLQRPGTSVQHIFRPFQ